MLWKTCGVWVCQSFPQFLHSFSTGFSTGKNAIMADFYCPIKVFHSFHSPDDDDEFN
jgi:hypothetical protein